MSLADYLRTRKEKDFKVWGQIFNMTGSSCSGTEALVIGQNRCFWLVGDGWLAEFWVGWLHPW